MDNSCLFDDCSHRFPTTRTLAVALRFLRATLTWSFSFSKFWNKWWGWVLSSINVYNFFIEHLRPKDNILLCVSRVPYEHHSHYQHTQNILQQHPPISHKLKKASWRSRGKANESLESFTSTNISQTFVSPTIILKCPLPLTSFAIFFSNHVQYNFNQLVLDLQRCRLPMFLKLVLKHVYQLWQVLATKNE